jgi:hypothetical protein
VKKKLEKKLTLTLNRETIRSLQTGELSPVAGAVSGPCPTDHYLTCGATCSCNEW